MATQRGGGGTMPEGGCIAGDRSYRVGREIPAPLVLERLNTLKPLLRARRTPRPYFFTCDRPCLGTSPKKHLNFYQIFKQALSVLYGS